MAFKIKIPEIGESINEVTISRWLKNDGDYVEVDELICEIESDKAALEVPSEKAGILKIIAKEDETIAVGATIAEIETSAKKPKKTVEAVEDGKVEQTQKAMEKGAKVSPVAAKILQEAGVSIESVTGSGNGGRIVKDDALDAIQQRKETAHKSTDDDTEKEATEEISSIKAGSRNEARKKLSTLRKTIARRLVAAKNETAMLTTFNEVDLSSIKQIRVNYKEIFKKKFDIGLGFMSFFTRAACIALKEWPALNAYIEDDEIVYHEFCDIAIAVSTPRGLVVPVIRNAEGLPLVEIERKIAGLAERARDNKLSIDEMTGGTFTITNGGVFGSLMSTPIINAPQSAILGMHKIMDRPMALDGEVVVRPMMYLALSYDHRIIDGRESVGFLVRIRELLEDPHRMLLEV
jgi:2-oxoglutarate dehydrogenase E2 component (dihydrolipoamide succinyltransferase)